jgi:fatty-acyl-CoA synthase
MDGTMMDFPLTIATIMRYGTTVFGDKEVVTCAGDQPARRRSYAGIGERAARLANALRSLGVDGDQRVGTFMWNNAEHLEAYLAIPSMGAVLHTLNLRLAPDQVGYIATHAGDYAVIVDASLIPLFANVLPLADTIKHVIVSGPADEAALGALAGPDREVLLRAAARRRAGGLRLARTRRALRGGHVLHKRDHRAAQGRRLQPPLLVHALDGRVHR